MAISAFVKVDDEVLPLSGGDGGGPAWQTQSGSHRDAVLPAGASFAVPEYAVGSGKLSVYVDGLRCFSGMEYDEVDSTHIAFTFDLKTDTAVYVVAVN